MSYKVEQESMPFSDYQSLKIYAEKNGTKKCLLHRTRRAQTGTAGAVDLSEIAGSAALTLIGKTELTMMVISSATDAALEHAVITAHYLDQDLVPHTATIADAVADMSGAGVTFDVSVTDFYCWDVENYGTSCFTSSLATGAGKTLSIVIGGVTYGTIAAEVKVATSTSLIGVGTVWGRTESNHGDLDGGIATLNWWTPIGTKKDGATCTYETGDSTTETPFMYLGFPIQDFYRCRTLKSSIVPTANTHSVILGDADLADANNGGTDMYALIEEGYESSIHTRYMVPPASISTSYFGRLKGTNSTASVVVAITCTPKDAIASVVFSYTIPAAAEPFEIGPFIQEALEPLSELSITILGNGAIFEAELTMIEMLA